MAISIVEVYRSSNGDRWKLVRNAETASVVVRHEPNPASGGRPTDTDVTDFLSIDGSGPEFAAVRRALEQDAKDASDA